MFYLWLLNSQKLCLNLSSFLRLPKRGSKGRQLHDRQYKLCKATTKVTELSADNRQHWFSWPGSGRRIPPSLFGLDMSGERPPRVKGSKRQTDPSGLSNYKVKNSFTTSPLSSNGALKCKTEDTNPKSIEWPQVGQPVSEDSL